MEATEEQPVNMEGDDDSDSESRRRRRGKGGTAAEQTALPLAELTQAADPLLDAEREKARKRAERFGLPYVEPVMAVIAEPEKKLTGEELIAAKAAKRLEVLKQRREKEAGQREGVFGFDTLTADEIKKKEERAAKYGVAPTGVTQEDVERTLREKAEAEAQEAARKKREERFGIVERPAAASMDIDFLERPVDPAPNAEVRPEVVHLYGCDTLSTKECLGYFKDFQPVFVEWINDSSCNVVFVDAPTAKRAMNSLGKKTSNPVPGEADMQGEMPEDRQWFKGPDFLKAGTPIPLSFRLATVLDAKVTKTKSRYLWLEHPPGLGIPAGGGKKRRQRDGGGEGGSAMETEESGAGTGRKQRKKKKQAEDAPADATAGGSEAALMADAELKAPIITEDLRQAVLAAKSALAAAAAGGGGRRLAMDVEGDDNDAVPDFGNEGP